MPLFSLNPIACQIFVSPIVWKGDPVGHIGTNDAFFFVVKGECYIRIEDESFIVKAGELVFLPKDKYRVYSTVNKDFVMYEVNFAFTINNEYWIDFLSLNNGKYHIEVDNPQYIATLFEQSVRREMSKDKMYDVIFYSSLSELIKIYVQKRREEDSKLRPFKSVVKYIDDNIDRNFKIDELSEIACMQSTYFIKKFKTSLGDTPITYVNKMKMFKAMSLLASTDFSVEKIGQKVGIYDSSYFAKLFRKHCFTTPVEYRKMFRKYKTEYMFEME